MSKSSVKRANNNTRRIANRVTIPPGATERFTPADAQKFARENGADPYLLEDANLPLLAELLNRRMAPRKTKSRPEFTPYPSPMFRDFGMAYRAPNPDPIRPRREPPTEDRYLASRYETPSNEQWRYDERRG